MLIPRSAALQATWFRPPAFAWIVWVMAAGGIAPADDEGRLAVALDAQSPAARESRMPAPSAAEQKAASGLVREIFGAEAAKAVTPEAKSALAAKLMQQAADGASTTESYVLLDAARKFAAEAGDVATATGAAELLAERFAIDRRAVILESLELAATKAPVRELGKAIDALLALSRTDADADRLEAATSAAQLAAVAVRRAGDAARRQACTEQLQSLKAVAKQMAEVQPLLDRLRANPADAEAAAQLGQVRCFMQGRWDEGLPLLARGNDAKLADLAKLEADSMVAALKLGDGWWAYGADDKATHSAAARSRAAFHYAEALPTLKGLEKARIEKRLQDFAAEDTAKGKSRRPRPPAPGLVLWLDASDSKSIRTFSGAVLDKGKGPARVAAWGDLSGAGHAAYQNDQERQPVWTPNGLGKLPGVEFDGKTGLIVDMPCGKAGTVVAVARPAKVDSMRVIGCHPDGVQHGTCLVICFRPNAQLLLQATTANANAIQQSTKPSYQAGTPVLLAAAWGQRLVFAVNGMDVAQPRSIDGFAMLSGPWGLGLTIPSAFVEPFNGSIAELMVFDRELEPEMIDAISRALMLKWAVAR